MSKDNTIKQCVLICEPITHDYESASVFTKLGTIPVIDLCMNWLTDNGIKQIFLFYSKTKAEIQEYHQQLSSNAKSETKVHLNYMKPQQLKNFGDVMRQVQFRNIIAQDFIVMYADTISNLDLSKAIQMHFKKKNQLKSVVLTTVLRDHSYDRKIHITSVQSNQILQMEEDTGKKFTLNKERINLKKFNVLFRRDLTHCQIYLCTVDVLKSFKQYYEYATMFDFINGMLTFEVYEEKILGHVLENHQHAFRINITKDYYLAYMHFIADHFYPYTLSTKTKSTKTDQLKFVTKNFNKIIFNRVSIPRTTYISNNCFIGEKCTIGHNASIEKSIISPGCQISNNATLKNCIILQGCTIAEKANFENCLIEKVNQTQQIRRFSIFPKFEAEIVTQPLFEETPPPEESTFEEELQQVVSEEPRMQIINQLNSIRKHHNKSLQQFLKQMIRLISPDGPSGVSSFAKNWGPIILKIHESQSLLLDSLYYSCENIQAYNKAFHVFIQYLYKQSILKDFAIIGWYDEAVNKYLGSLMLQKCQAFISLLKQQQEQEDQEDEEGSGNSDEDQ